MSSESDTDDYSDAYTDTDSNSDASTDSNSQPEPDEEYSDDERKGGEEEREIDFQARTREDYNTDLDPGDDPTWNWRNAENNRLIHAYIKYHKQQDKKIKELNDRLSKLVATLIRTRFLPQNYYDATDAAAAVMEELSPPRAGPRRVFAAQPTIGGRKRRKKRTRKKRRKKKTKKRRKKNRKKRTKRRKKRTRQRSKRKR